MPQIPRIFELFSICRHLESQGFSKVAIHQKVQSENPKRQVVQKTQTDHSNRQSRWTTQTDSPIIQGYQTS